MLLTRAMILWPAAVWAEQLPVLPVLSVQTRASRATRATRATRAICVRGTAETHRDHLLCLQKKSSLSLLVGVIGLYHIVSHFCDIAVICLADML